MNSAANFVFTSKIGPPRVVLVLRWVLFVRQIFVSPHLEFEQHINSSDPRPDTVGEPWSCPIGFTAPSKASARTFLNWIPQLEGRKVKHHCRLRDHTHFFYSFPCLSIADREAVSRSAAVLPIKALALQKRPLFVPFALAGITAAILDVAISRAVEGAPCKTIDQLIKFN